MHPRERIPPPRLAPDPGGQTDVAYWSVNRWGRPGTVAGLTKKASRNSGGGAPLFAQPSAAVFAELEGWEPHPATPSVSLQPVAAGRIQSAENDSRLFLAKHELFDQKRSSEIFRTGLDLNLEAALCSY